LSNQKQRDIEGMICLTEWAKCRSALRRVKGKHLCMAPFPLDSAVLVSYTERSLLKSGGVLGMDCRRRETKKYYEQAGLEQGHDAGYGPFRAADC
jgi:hypothetical protein